MNRSTLNTVLNILTWAGVGIVVVFAVLLVGLRIFGLQPVPFVSDSGESAYRSGDLVYVRSVDTDTLKVGDVITYRTGEKTVSTHAITEILTDENDPSVLRFMVSFEGMEEGSGTLVHYKNVVGMPKFSLPLLGYVASFISAPPGVFVAMGFGVLIAGLIFLPDLFAGKGRKRGRFERRDH